MVLVLEIAALIVLAVVAVGWYLRTPMHRARKTSNVFPPQISGHMGFGMYTPSNPTPHPHGLHGHRDRGRDET